MPDPIWEDVRFRKITRVEYHRMVDAGILGEDDRVELLDGMLVGMSPQNAAHAFSVEALTAILSDLLHGRNELRLRVQLPLATDDATEPEPDLAIIRARPYSEFHPSTALLVIEVSDSSLATDRKLKSLAYAKAGVPEYWIVDLVGRGIEVRRNPGAEGYSSMVRLGDGESVRCGSIDGVEIAVSDALPPK